MEDGEGGGNERNMTKSIGGEKDQGEENDDTEVQRTKNEERTHKRY
jgi:hypothetical protein